VAPNACVRDSILLHDCQVREGARLAHVVSDKDAVFHDYCHVGLDDGAPVGDAGERLTVVGKGVQVMQGVRVEPGVEIPINAVLSADVRRPEIPDAAPEDSPHV
jgi:ADP-glucose pyrophosphorylase